MQIFGVGSCDSKQSSVITAMSKRNEWCFVNSQMWQWALLRMTLFPTATLFSGYVEQQLEGEEDIVNGQYISIWKEIMTYLSTKLNSMIWVRERTTPTERPPPVGEVIANFCG
jgi:hypothetical protein